MKKLLYTFALLGLLFTACCKKNSPYAPDIPSTLPPETQTGANTFGCMINGVLWLPKGGNLVPAYTSSYGSGTLLVVANKAAEDESIRIYLTLDSIGHFSITGHNSPQNVCYRISSNYYFADSIIQGVLNITKFDTINHIVSGTFYFDAVKDTQRYQIRQGRFDLKLY